MNYSKKKSRGMKECKLTFASTMSGVAITAQCDVDKDLVGKLKLPTGPCSEPLSQN